MRDDSLLGRASHHDDGPDVNIGMAQAGNAMHGAQAITRIDRHL